MDSMSGRTRPTLTAAEGAPSEALHGLEDFVSLVEQNPEDALRAVNIRLSTNQMVAMAEISEAGTLPTYNSKVFAALGNLLTNRYDIWADYDPTTTAAIKQGLGSIETPMARPWRVITYISSLVEWSSQQADKLAA